MSATEAAAFFENVPVVSRILTTLVDVGMGYAAIGQPATTLSGRRSPTGETGHGTLPPPHGPHALYILDEPTTGLHFADVEKLLGVLQRLVDGGNTVLVIEHNSGRHQDRRLDHRPRPRRGLRRRRNSWPPAPRKPSRPRPGSHTGEHIKNLVSL
jgi:excinuclease ABC subunit A